MTDFETSILNKHIKQTQNKILSRNYPDIRDGLTEIERGVLYGLYELDQNNGKLINAAQVIGVVMGHYVPMGYSVLSSVITRFSRIFKTQNYPLLSTEGIVSNAFESDDGADFRNWKCNFSEYGHQLFANIEDECVDYSVNFDGTYIPDSLPSAFPNLLCNGSKTIPGHELCNVKKAIIATIENPNITENELAAILDKPKFADSRILLEDDFSRYYSTGNQDIRFHYPNNEEILIFQASNIVLDNNETRLVTTKEMIKAYIEYRKNILSRLYKKQNGKSIHKEELKKNLLESINNIK